MGADSSRYIGASPEKVRAPSPRRWLPQSRHLRPRLGPPSRVRGLSPCYKPVTKNAWVAPRAFPYGGRVTEKSYKHGGLRMQISSKTLDLIADLETRGAVLRREDRHEDAERLTGAAQGLRSAYSVGGTPDTTLSPRERLWREAVSRLAREVIQHVAPDPTAKLGFDYAEQVAYAAELLKAEAQRAVGELVTTAEEPAPAAPATDGEPPYGGINPDKLYTAKEAAPLIGIKHPRTLYTMGRSNRIAVTRTGPKRGNTRFKGSDLIEYLEAGSS